jgi:thiamine-phosphate pyrophosphorylase
MANAPIEGLHGIAGSDSGPDGEPRDPVAVARALCAGGARSIQLRLKGVGAGEWLATASAVRDVCREGGVPFIVNDRADVAVLAGADGVHVGHADLSPAAARRIVGEGGSVGVSTHGLDEVGEALRAGADYLGFGPVFAGGAKAGAREPRGTDALAAAVRAAGSVPVIAIGGVDAATAGDVARTGAAGVAVITAVSGADDMEAATRRVVRSFRQGRSP